MTLDEAIKILGYTIDPPFSLVRPNTRLAIQLGIEALIELKELRKSSLWGEAKLLPGEDPSEARG